MPAPSSPVVSELRGVPPVGIPLSPALLSDSGDLWLAYRIAPPHPPQCAVVRFSEVIDHRLSPINDEGLGEHPYARYGLTFYSFHQVVGSAEALRWSILGAKHFVVTFKDDTLDVLARDLHVVAAGVPGVSDPLQALLATLPLDPASVGLPPAVPLPKRRWWQFRR